MQPHAQVVLRSHPKALSIQGLSRLGRVLESIAAGLLPRPRPAPRAIHESMINLSSADLADIHAWLSSLPKAQDYRSIPLINP